MMAYVPNYVAKARKCKATPGNAKRHQNPVFPSVYQTAVGKNFLVGTQFLQEGIEAGAPWPLVEAWAQLDIETYLDLHPLSNMVFLWCFSRFCTFETHLQKWCFCNPLFWKPTFKCGVFPLFCFYLCLQTFACAESFNINIVTNATMLDIHWILTDKQYDTGRLAKEVSFVQKDSPFWTHCRYTVSWRCMGIAPDVVPALTMH